MVFHCFETQVWFELSPLKLPLWECFRYQWPGRKQRKSAHIPVSSATPKQTSFWSNRSDNQVDKRSLNPPHTTQNHPKDEGPSAEELYGVQYVFYSSNTYCTLVVRNASAMVVVYTCLNCWAPLDQSAVAVVSLNIMTCRNSRTAPSVCPYIVAYQNIMSLGE